LYGWLIVLSRCKASDEIWKEWLLWQDNPIRLKTGKVASQHAEAKLKGDYSFIEVMADAGDTRRAWEMLRDSGIPFRDCRSRLRRTLLRDIQYATLWDAQISLDLLEQYDFELKKVENALGVEWIALDDDQGYHKPTDSMQQSLEALSSPFFNPEPDFGYPYDLSAEGMSVYHLCRTLAHRHCRDQETTCRDDTSC
jgi:hypothetical protein